MRRIAFIIALTLACASTWIHAESRALDEPLRIRLMSGESTITIRSTKPIAFEPNGANITFNAGAYTLSAIQPVAAQQHIHLFTKTFKLHATDDQKAYLANLRAQGYDPRIVTLGRNFDTASGRTIDTRINWISVERVASQAEVADAKAKLESLGHFAWSQAETTAPGACFIQVLGARGGLLASFAAPLTIQSAGLIEIDNVDTGFWDENRRHLAYSGDLQLRVSTEGQLEVLEILPIEEYLRGVLPAEMPYSWDPQALQAQAIAARSDVIAGLGSRYSLEGFDFLGNEQSRAYVGAGGRKTTTDEALNATSGMILIKDDRIVPTVFSATCGGWTENNDTVWYGPPDGALRGTNDLIDPVSSASPTSARIRDWLLNPPDAWCARDKKYFRWKQTYSEEELRDIISKRYPVGEVKSIELGERGVSGRLKSIRIFGTEKTETIHKELPIRLALGGLPSAMFILNTSTSPQGVKTYTFQGGGRGHGVGMCQHGAQAMAQGGKTHGQILSHYYPGTHIERCQ